MTRHRIAAVVLAAGGSTRLGQPKQLLELGGVPLLEHVLRTVRQTAVDERFVVLGHAADAVRRRTPLDGFQVINNPDYADGQSTSIVAAVNSIPDDISAVVFVLGDQPLQVSEVINRLAESYRNNPTPIIQPQYHEGPGNPVLIDRTLFPELVTLRGDTGARPVLRERRDEIRRIDCSQWLRPVDVDTLDDYQRVKEDYESRVDVEDG